MSSLQVLVGQARNILDVEFTRTIIKRLFDDFKNSVVACCRSWASLGFPKELFFSVGSPWSLRNRLDGQLVAVFAQANSRTYCSGLGALLHHQLRTFPPSPNCHIRSVDPFDHAFGTVEWKYRRLSTLLIPERERAFRLVEDYDEPLDTSSGLPCIGANQCPRPTEVRFDLS